MANKLKLTRNQLAQFLSDHESIKQFEALFAVADALAPDLLTLLELLINNPANAAHTALALDYIDMRANAPHVTLPRRLAWNDADGTLDIGMGYDGVVQQVGLETYYRIKASAAISDGDLVMFDGAVGASGVIKGRPSAIGLTEGLRIMGVATMDIPNNGFGYVTAFGLVRGIDTTGTSVGEVWADGNILYYNPAVVGRMTNVRPTSPNEVVIVAAVVNAGPGGSGSLFVRTSFYPKLFELSDVYAPAPTKYQPLRWNNSTSRWEAASDLYLNEIVMDKTAGAGLKVDHAAPAYGWRDLLGFLETRPAAGGGAAAIPDFVAYRGNIYQYRFGTIAPNNHLHEAFIQFHIPHDYAPGTDMYFHIHWSQIVVDTGGTAGVPGVAKWYFDFSYADGHGTPGGAADPFVAPLTISVTQQGSTTQYGHMIAEVAFTNNGGDATHLDRNTIQVDGVILLRVYRDPGDAADTLNQDTFLHFCDIHYQSTSVATKNKAPNFYA